MSIALRLHQIMKDRGLLQRELAAVLGVTRQAFGRYLNGSVEPDREKIEKLADFLGVTPTFLMFGHDEADDINSDSVSIPVLSLDDTNPIRLMQVKKEWITFQAMDANLASLKVAVIVDDNMDPTLRKGDMVIVDTSVKTIHKEGIYVLEVNDQKFVKRAQMRLDGRLLLIDDNIHYGHLTLDQEQVNSIRVLGKCLFGFKAKAL